jgi:hypothetical protein
MKKKSGKGKKRKATKHPKSSKTRKKTEPLRLSKFASTKRGLTPRQRPTSDETFREEMEKHGR